MATDEKQQAAAAPLEGEIASAKRDFITMPVWAGLLRNLDDVLLLKGGWKGLKIYEELERDPHVYSVLEKRKRAVTSRPWCLDPADESAAAKAAAALVTRQFQNVQFNRINKDFLDATNKGFSVGETIWKYQDGEIQLADIKKRNQRRFIFDENSVLKLLTRDDPWRGEYLPERKFIVHSVGSEDGSPYGLGLGNRLFWPVLFKRQDITFWLTFADKYGSPTALGKYPAGASDAQQAKLLDVLRMIAHDTGIIIPEGMTVELLEAKRSGSADVYEPLARYFDEQISKCVLGETMSTTAEGAGMGSSQADVHNEVRIEAAEDDAELLCAALNGTLVRWIVDLNMPGAPYPTLKRDFGKPEDLTQRAKRDQLLRQMGADFTEEYIRETYGDGVVWTPGMAPPGQFAAPPPEGEDPGAAFAERQARGLRLRSTKRTQQDQIELSQGVEKLADKALIQGRLDALQALLDESGDFAGFTEGLAKLAADAAPAPLAEALARAGFAAHLAGRTPQA